MQRPDSNQPEATATAVTTDPPVWFKRYWPVVFTVTTFLAGLGLAMYDVVPDQAADSIMLGFYLLLMGIAPLSFLAKALKL